MKIAVKTADQVEPVPVTMDGVEGVTLRLLVHEVDGAPNFYMRQFTITPGGHTPKHTHPWEHEVYILSGTATLGTAEGDRQARAGDSVFIPGNEVHQFVNATDEDLTFLCLVPKDSQ